MSDAYCMSITTDWIGLFENELIPFISLIPCKWPHHPHFKRSKFGQKGLVKNTDVIVSILGAINLDNKTLEREWEKAIP